MKKKVKKIKSILKSNGIKGLNLKIITSNLKYFMIDEMKELKSLNKELNEDIKILGSRIMLYEEERKKLIGLLAFCYNAYKICASGEQSIMFRKHIEQIEEIIQKSIKDLKK